MPLIVRHANKTCNNKRAIRSPAIDVNLACQLGANSFLVKPVDLERFVEISQALNGYWMWMSKTPDTYRASERDRKTILDRLEPPISASKKEPPA